MKDVIELERLVDSVIHSVILTFDPEVPETYARCVEILDDLARKIEAFEMETSQKNGFLIRVRAHLASMALDVGDHSGAELLATDVLRRSSVEDPNFSLAILIKVEALHSLGRHDEEVCFGLEYADSEGMDGHALVSLLSRLTRHHAESMKWKASLIARIVSYVARSPFLADRIQAASPPSEDPGSYVLAVADALRQISREETERILGENHFQG